MNKSEVIMRLMEAVAGDEVKQLPIEVEAGWTQRAKLRRVVPRVLREWCPHFGIESELTEKKRLLSSTFRLVLTGPMKGLNSFARVWETNLRLAWHNETD